VIAGDDIAKEILVRAQSGDRIAFGQIVESTKSKLYPFIRRYVGDADDAYDILQNTYVSAWLGIGKFNPEKPILPWLRTIALNKCRDHGRRTAVQRFLLLAKAQELETAPDASGDERLDRLDRAIPKLPTFYREPLLLTSISGLSHVEAAQILKTSPKAVEMRVRRARAKLLVILGDEAEG
jgi:RNA polymerase sigma-70 factor (ECF subfamily)